MYRVFGEVRSTAIALAGISGRLDEMSSHFQVAHPSVLVPRKTCPGVVGVALPNPLKARYTRSGFVGSTARCAILRVGSVTLPAMVPIVIFFQFAIVAPLSELRQTLP